MVHHQICPVCQNGQPNTSSVVSPLRRERENEGGKVATKSHILNLYVTWKSNVIYQVLHCKYWRVKCSLTVEKLSLLSFFSGDCLVLLIYSNSTCSTWWRSPCATCCGWSGPAASIRSHTSPSQEDVVQDKRLFWEINLTEDYHSKYLKTLKCGVGGLGWG